MSQFIEYVDRDPQELSPTSGSQKWLPKNQTLYLRVLSRHFLSSNSLGPCTLPCRAFSMPTALWWRRFSQYPTWRSPWHFSSPLVPCKWGLIRFYFIVFDSVMIWAVDKMCQRNLLGLAQWMCMCAIDIWKFLTGEIKEMQALTNSSWGR